LILSFRFGISRGSLSTPQTFLRCPYLFCFESIAHVWYQLRFFDPSVIYFTRALLQIQRITRVFLVDAAGRIRFSVRTPHLAPLYFCNILCRYSVIDDHDSITQQLMYWLSVIPEPTSSQVRLVFVGSKIDLIAPSKLQAVLKHMRRIVWQVVEAKFLVKSVQESDILFLSALQSFKHEDSSSHHGEPALNTSWASCRRALKDRIYAHCGSIFTDSSPQFANLSAPKYPAAYHDFAVRVARLKKELLTTQQLPCCALDHPDAVSILGGMYKEHSERINYFKSEFIMDALHVLHDLGIIVLYGNQPASSAATRSSHVEHLSSLSSTTAQWCAFSICLEPQFLPGIISLLVDPQTCIPAVTTVESLMHVMETNPGASIPPQIINPYVTHSQTFLALQRTPPTTCSPVTKVSCWTCCYPPTLFAAVAAAKSFLFPLLFEAGLCVGPRSSTNAPELCWQVSAWGQPPLPTPPLQHFSES